MEDARKGLKCSVSAKGYYASSVKPERKILVTGGTGFLGKRLTERLVVEGYPVRVFVRRLSNIEPLERLGVDIVLGDLADKTSVDRALKGIDVIIHAAAATRGGKADYENGNVLGTRHVLDLSKNNGVRKLVYISSCSVYGVADYKTNQVVTEESSLERFPWLRGDYSASKQRAELLVTDATKSGDFPIVILRPGTIYGPDGENYTPMMGLSLAHRIFLVFGSGTVELPLVYIDNLIDAILWSVRSASANNQTFNVVDTARVTKKQYMEKLIKKLYPKSRTVYLPYSLLYCLTWLQEKAFGLVRRTPLLTTYRLTSSQRQIKYDASKIRSTIGWQPRLTFDQAVAEIVSRKGTRSRVPHLSTYGINHPSSE